MEDIVYRIPEDPITKGTYIFSEKPDQCGYDQKITVSGIPFWAVHDEANRQFTVPKTNDNSRVGAYPVTIESTIEKWTDYTKT